MLTFYIFSANIFSFRPKPLSHQKLNWRIISLNLDKWKKGSKYLTSRHSHSNESKKEDFLLPKSIKQ